MRLFIAEKPSLGRAIAAVLGQPQKMTKTHIEAGTDIVAWAAGHLLEQLPPDQYDEKYKRWNLADLPIIPEKWKLNVRQGSKDLFNNLKRLLEKADEVIHAGDVDREGQLLIDEILEYCKYEGPVLRLQIRDTNPDAVREALVSLEPNENFSGNRDAARARGRADWLHGMNMTRLYTKLAEKKGYKGPPLRIGRVKTPVTALVVRRDLEIESFTPKPYWVLRADIKVPYGAFLAIWKPKEEQTGLDEEGRLVEKTIGDALADTLKGQEAKIIKHESKKHKIKPPLGFSLPQLQIAASKKHDLSPAKVLSICQRLYERGILTYPRSDCEYLPEPHQKDASKVIGLIEKLSPVTIPVEVDFKKKAPVFNSKKVEEHHAIIPSVRSQATEQLEGDEAMIFDLVARRYISFFMLDHEYLQSNVIAEISEESFAASGREIKVNGWKAIEHEEENQEENEEDDDTRKLPPMTEGDIGVCRELQLQEKKTKAPPRFTEASLLKAMNEVHRFVADSKIKKVLKETDGIGTAATQAGIIQELIDFGQLSKQKKQLISTPPARNLIQALPEAITLPDLTAIWELEFRKIKEGKTTLDETMQKIEKEIRDRVLTSSAITVSSDEGKRQSSPNPTKQPQKHDVRCPRCGATMIRRNGKNGPFWGCSKYPECRSTASDKDGKAVFQKQKEETTL